MKTVTYGFTIIAFSALLFVPKIPKEYPPEEVIKERIIIKYQEEKLNDLIDRVEYELKKDSLQVNNKR